MKTMETAMPLANGKGNEFKSGMTFIGTNLSSIKNGYFLSHAFPCNLDSSYFRTGVHTCTVLCSQPYEVG